MSLDDIANAARGQAEAVRHLAELVAADSTERAQFVETVTKSNRAIQLSNRVQLVFAVVMTLMLAVTGYGVWNIIDARPAGRAIQRTISDCVNPAGECYRQARASEAARDQAVVGRLVEALRGTADCRYGVAEDLRQCLNEAFTRALNEPTAP